MDRTRASLRRVRVYAALIVACGAFALLPSDHRAEARDRVKTIIHSIIEWAVDITGEKL